MIEQGSYWRHTNGNRYQVLHLANLLDDDKYPLTVVYQGGNGKVWTRRASDWHRSMTLCTQVIIHHNFNL